MLLQKKLDYPKCVDNVRAGIVVSASVFSAGTMLGLQLGNGRVAAIFARGFLLCILAAVCLAFEYLLRSWWQWRRKRPATWQFTLQGMIAFTTMAAIVSAFVHYLGPIFLLVFLILLVSGVILAGAIFATMMELIHRPRSPENRRSVR